MASISGQPGKAGTIMLLHSGNGDSSDDSQTLKCANHLYLVPVKLSLPAYQNSFYRVDALPPALPPVKVLKAIGVYKRKSDRQSFII